MTIHTVAPSINTPDDPACLPELSTDACRVRKGQRNGPQVKLPTDQAHEPLRLLTAAGSVGRDLCLYVPTRAAGLVSPAQRQSAPA
jgi:hypothetical protein